jgi:hypothetical protein
MRLLADFGRPRRFVFGQPHPVGAETGRVERAHRPDGFPIVPKIPTTVVRGAWRLTLA